MLSLALIFSLTACTEKEDQTDSSKSSVSSIGTTTFVSEEGTVDATTTTRLSTQSTSKSTVASVTTASTPSASTQTTVKETPVTNQKSDTLLETTTTSVNRTTTSTTVVSTVPITTTTSVKAAVSTTTTTTENTDSGVLEKVDSKQMTVPENMKWLGNNAKEENNAKTIKARVALYHLDGDVVNWTTEDDLIYVITSGNNRLVVIDSATMMAICNVPLAGEPAEMNLVGDDIYISLPDLCRIDKFSKMLFNKTASLYFEHEVSSFCVDNEVVYYSTHDQHCDVYKKNMSTNELTKILPDRGFTFYQPKLYLNQQDNLLYIGETGSSGSTLYYYDAETLQLKSLFRKNNYGIMNHTRDIFHVGDTIFWGNYRLSDTNANELVGRYGVADYGSVNFASNELVSTFEGIFLADTYECVVDYFDAGFPFEYILISESYNVFFRSRGVDQNIIMGINFNVQ